MKNNSGEYIRLRKNRKSGVKGFYHFGAVLLISGVIVACVSLAFDVFTIFVYDNRHPAQFHLITANVRLFSISSKLQSLDGNTTDLLYPPNLQDPQWFSAKALAILSVVSGILSLLVHFVICRRECTWKEVFIEILLLFIAVVSLLICISLTECQIGQVHDTGDATLVKMLQDNELLAVTSYEDEMIVAPPDFETRPVFANEASSVFSLVLSVPKAGFYVLIAADVCLLLAFLSILVFFVKKCEEAEDLRKQLMKAKVSST